MDYILFFIKALPFELAVVFIAGWLAVVSWLIYRRRSDFPSRTISGLIADVEKMETLVQEHVTELATIGERLDALGRERRDDKERLDGLITTNSGEHTVMTEKLAEIAEGVAEIRGWRSGKANGAARRTVRE